MKNVVFLGVFLAVLSGCGGSGGDSDSVFSGATSPSPRPELSGLIAYRTDGEFKDVLADCVTVTSAEESCTLAALPLMGQRTVSPTAQDIMERVVVTHPWMGSRFEQVLARLPADVKTLMKGVTAIVIADNIRPSYYSSRTGAIYLDSAYLWLTNGEKATISRQKDPRSDYGRELNFVSLARLVKNNDYAYTYYSLSGSEERTLEDILYPVAAVLYHELAHANDFFPPDQVPLLEADQPVALAAQNLEFDRVSVQLEGFIPLSSTMLKGLAAVLFRGQTPTFEEKGYDALTVGLEFEADGASDDYAYTSRYEDVAMLFEETMMMYHYGLERDIAYSNVPATANPACDEFIVRWGSRGRLGDPLVKSRAEFVMERLLPAQDLNAFFAGLPLPVPLRDGFGWCSNLDPTPFPASVQTLGLGKMADRVRVDALPISH